MNNQRAGCMAGALVALRGNEQAWSNVATAVPSPRSGDSFKQLRCRAVSPLARALLVGLAGVRRRNEPGRLVDGRRCT